MDLIGIWSVDSADIDAMSRLGQVVIEFQADGDMIYGVRTGSLVQTLEFTYEVVGDDLVMKQPSDPVGGRVRFSVSADGVLTLYYETLTAHFLRED